MRTENPALQGGASKRLAGLTHPNSTPVESRTRIRLGERADKFLAGISDALADGRLDLWQLPLSISSLYLLGYEQGRASRDSELSALDWEASYWHFRASNPRDSWHRFAELELWRQGSEAA